MEGYRRLDTNDWNTFLNSSAKWIQQYENINTQFKAATDTLLQSWEGYGAEAFREDAKQVMSNLKGIQDILETMCSTLSDCKAIFDECDRALKASNENAAAS